MDLFVVNRVDSDKIQNTEDDEQAKLAKVLKQIERKKNQRARQKEKEKTKKQAKIKAFEERQFKREIKSTIISVPDNKLDDFIEQPANTPAEQKSKKRKKNEVESIEGFTILGSQNIAKKTKVKRVLPKWLSNPTIISSDLQELTVKVSSIKSLDKSIRNQLKANGINYFFPVQSAVIPWLLQVSKHSNVIFPRDVCVSAPTGSGKTLAFVLPIVQVLKRNTVKKIRALVILPTQDLAAQVFKSFKAYTQGTDLETCLITGSKPFEHEQKQLLGFNEAFGFYSKVDILVCTAGRLVDHIKSTKGFNLQFLEFLVIDEADRVLESVQHDWLYHLEKHIKVEDEPSKKILNIFTLKNRRPPQKLLFSATLSQDPEKLEKLSLFQPKLFTAVVENEDDAEEDGNQADMFIGKYTTPKELSEKYIVCSKELKPLVLYKFIKNEQLVKTLIFTHSIDSAHRLMILLKSLFGANKKIDEISSNFHGKSRNELIENFSKGNLDILICTDSLARGIDLPGVQCVISYSAPKFLKTYIHRAGRTARAGEQGLAVTLVHNEQVAQLKTLFLQSNKHVEELKISEDDVEPLGKKYKKALNALKETIKSEEKTELKKVISVKRSVKKRQLPGQQK